MTSLSEAPEEEPIAKLQAAESSVFASRWEQFTPYIAEFWGTLVITATFLCNVDGAGTDPAFKSISQAFMVIGIVSATKHITGASLNPSVSLALALAGRQKLRTAGLLCVAQIAGGLTAATQCFEAGVAKELVLGPLKFHNWVQVGLLESLYACMLCLVYLNCAASTKNNPKGDQNGFIGIAVGCCYLASHNAAEGICSTVSNSAVAIGLLVYGAGGIHLSHGVGYFLYDLLGAFLAAGIYRVLRPKEFVSLSRLNEDNTQESAVLGSEFIGTFYIVLTQVSSRLSGEQDLGPQAWGTAAAVIAMVCALRDVSGAQPSCDAGCALQWPIASRGHGKRPQGSTLWNLLCHSPGSRRGSGFLDRWHCACLPAQNEYCRGCHSKPNLHSRRFWRVLSLLCGACQQCDLPSGWFQVQAKQPRGCCVWICHPCGHSDCWEHLWRDAEPRVCRFCHHGGCSLGQKLLAG